MPLWAWVTGIALGSLVILIVIIAVFFTDYSK